MSASITKSSPWDFTEVFKALHSPVQEKPSPLGSSPHVINTPSKRRSRLGDFSKLFQELGIEPDVSEQEQNPVTSNQLASNEVAVNDYAIPNPSHPPAPPLRDEIYASDGGFTQSTRKNVRWRDETTHVPTTPTSEDEPVPSHLTELFKAGDVEDTSNGELTKQERKRLKKQRQKEKKRLSREAELEQARTRKVFSDIESESEIKKLPRVTPASKASKHLAVPSPIASASPTVPAIPTILKRPTPTTSDDEKRLQPQPFAKGQASNQKQHVSHERGSSAELPSTPTRSTNFAQRQIPGNLLPTSVPQVARSTPAQDLSRTLQSQFAGSVPAHVPITTSPSKPSPKQVCPFSTVRAQVVSQVKANTQRRVVPNFTGMWWQPYHPQNPDLLVSSQQSSPVSPYNPDGTVRTPLNTVPSANHAHTIDPFMSTPRDTSSVSNTRSTSYDGLTPPSRQFQILPKEDRELQLLLRLVHDFGEDKKWLTRPVPMADHNADPDGIHVFVDFSNIWIGFMDHLKWRQSRMRQNIPHQQISFDALVLLLERKRPVAKRVLAGSFPLMPAMELAKQIGYETLILEKVYKSREPSEKQRRIMALQSRNAFAALGTQGSPTPNGMSSSPSAAGHFLNNPPNPLQPTPAPEKWVEQGVDEVLHLRILESVIDSDQPSTMVVATGDAAKAEYSNGFKEMIVRALKKGWMVELVAFQQSISNEYWKRSFQEEWQNQFRILCLDEYAQYLLDT